MLCREVLLSSVNVGVLGSLFTWGAVARPKNLGLQSVGEALVSSAHFLMLLQNALIMHELLL